MATESSLTGLRGCLIDTPEFGRVRCWREGGVVMSEGKIVAVGDFDYLRKTYDEHRVAWRHVHHGVILPGLIDLHTHLPQYHAVARGENQLLPWLRTSIFPLEREFTGPKPRREIPAFFEELARHGTTTAAVYCAIFEDTCDAAFEAAEKLGLRVIMGKTMMDVASYGQLQPKKIVSISMLESERLCKKWNGAADGLLEYAFSPRFAVSCSERLMRGAGELATQYGAYLQTHLSENKEEIDKVRNLFMQSRHYTDVYRMCELLGPKTLLGHCIHLSDEELGILRKTNSAVAHCPTSNFFLGSGIMKLDQFMELGIRVGLGSDVAAGPELNLWQVMRSAVDAQKARSFFEPETRVLKVEEAFYLATLGGATALGKQDIIGTLDKGKEADLLVMDLSCLLPYPKLYPNAADSLSPQDILALCVYRAGPQAVLETYVRGKKIYAAPHQTLF